MSEHIWFHPGEHLPVQGEQWQVVRADNYWTDLRNLDSTADRQTLRIDTVDLINGFSDERPKLRVIGSRPPAPPEGRDGATLGACSA